MLIKINHVCTYHLESKTNGDKTELNRTFLETHVGRFLVDLGYLSETSGTNDRLSHGDFHQHK